MSELDDIRLENLRALLKQIPQQPQRQDSTMDQLEDLVAVANQCGMYDAADWLKGQLETWKKRAERTQLLVETANQEAVRRRLRGPSGENLNSEIKK